MGMAGRGMGVAKKNQEAVKSQARKVKSVSAEPKLGRKVEKKNEKKQEQKVEKKEKRQEQKVEKKEKKPKAAAGKKGAMLGQLMI